MTALSVLIGCEESGAVAAHPAPRQDQRPDAGRTGRGGGEMIAQEARND